MDAFKSDLAGPEEQAEVCYEDRVKQLRESKGILKLDKDNLADWVKIT